MKATVAGEPSRVRRRLRTLSGPNVTLAVKPDAREEAGFDSLNPCSAQYFHIPMMRHIFKACRNVYFTYWRDAVSLTFALVLIDSLLAI